MNKRLIIVAYNVHTGGGKTLLLALIKNIPINVELILYADYRLKEVILGMPHKFIFIRNSVFARLWAEVHIRLTVKDSDVSLMFNGLPPLFKNKSRSYLFIQNINNISQTCLHDYPFFQLIRILLERLWLRLFYLNVHKIIVQTNFVKDTLIRNHSFKKEILVLPFFDIKNIKNIQNSENNILRRNYDQFIFIYPASHEPHKNHVNLIKAWKILESQNINPVLYLTLNESVFTDLINELSVSKSLKIINLGLISRDLLLDFYNKCDCMIFPSKYESFGLPLIEATQFKLPIVAPELDYVREVCCPVETFDPLSPLSLSDSVKRFLGIKLSSLAIKDPEDFLIFLLKGR